MIAPVKHVSDISELLPSERADIMEHVVEVKELLSKKLHPHGFNIGINSGAVAGAGIVDHVHIHIVPRWNGDTNFMPVLTDTRVIPQSLDALYELLMV
jgi:ATP adenylyltransferase